MIMFSLVNSKRNILYNNYFDINITCLWFLSEALTIISNAAKYLEEELNIYIIKMNENFSYGICTPS